MGRTLLGKVCGDEIQIGSGKDKKTLTIVGAA